MAWDEGHPFPEDEAKWFAATLELRRACPAGYNWYLFHAEYRLRSGATSRAARLGCKIGRSVPILRVYERAVHAPVLLCYWCKALTFPGGRHVDHKQPLATGGAHVAVNLCITCIECNLAKGDTKPDEFQKMVAGKRTANSLVAAEYFRSASSA